MSRWSHKNLEWCSRGDERTIAKGFICSTRKVSTTKIECSTSKKKYLELCGDGNNLLGTDKEKHKLHAHSKPQNSLLVILLLILFVWSSK